MEAAREKQATAEQYAREQRRLNRRLKALVAVASCDRGRRGSPSHLELSRASRRPTPREVRQAQAMLAGEVDGKDVQAFHELLDAYRSVHNDGPLVNALEGAI